jgi:hypothetical protein
MHQRGTFSGTLVIDFFTIVAVQDELLSSLHHFVVLRRKKVVSHGILR